MKRPLNWVVLVGDPRDPWRTAAVFGVYQYKKDAEAFAAEYHRRDSFRTVKVVRLHRPHLTSDLSDLRGGNEG